MSVRGKILGAAAGAAGIAVAGTAVRVAQRQRVIARRGAGQDTPFGSLRSDPLVVVADDGTDLHVEVDEPSIRGSRAAPDPQPLTVVFAHGYALNLDCWHYQRAAYRGRVRSVFYDQRSHGRSGRSPVNHCTVEQLGEDLLRVIEATAPGPVVLVGHSMGGMGVISLAQHHPELFGDKVVGVALLSTTAGGLDTGRLLFPVLPLGLSGRLVGRAVSALGRGHRVVDLLRSRGRDLAEVVTDDFAFGRDAPRDHVDFVVDMLDATPFSVVADFWPAFATLDSFDHLGALAQVPTTVIAGTDDKIVGIGHSRRLHARIHGSSLLEVEGAGHMVIIERPDDVAAELDDLLDAAGQLIGGRTA
ncbi:alpha/beta fold hydrolase [Nocardioides sp. LHG3406-4]|uniref:alpha/beta fold hydrolase n=1 Tax=Nocardioides sp. LHG3406-4 TaxID=2804575 RepID=UPI003CED8F92